MPITQYKDRIDRVVFRATLDQADDDFWNIAWSYPDMVVTPVLEAGIEYIYTPAPYQPPRELPDDIQALLDAIPAPAPFTPMTHLYLATDQDQVIQTNEGRDITI